MPIRLKHYNIVVEERRWRQPSPISGGGVTERYRMKSEFLKIRQKEMRREMIENMSVPNW